MKRGYIVLVILLFGNVVFSQEVNSDTKTCDVVGIDTLLDTEVVKVEKLLQAYREIKVYKKIMDESGKDKVIIAPLSSDINVNFANDTEKNQEYYLSDLSGVNFGAIKALNEIFVELNATVEELEKSQEKINQQEAIISQLQNDLVQLMGEVEELKQKNLDTENNLNELRIEVNTPPDK